jgi:DNA-binding SARP family transcriptional activator/Flp pilus assembly protein TadD
VKSLRISLLGAPWVEVDGAPLAVDTRKATAMLAFLAVTGHSHARGGVADLLWAELDADRSRGALRRTLSTLRSALGEGRVVSDRDSIALDLDGAWFDLAEFRSVAGDPDAETPALIAACDLHRGDLLAGFGLRDSLAFDEWQRDAEELVRRERAALLDRVVDRLAREGRVDDAVVRARQRLELDQLHEPTHRRLIECYAAAGRRGDAFTQYRECVRVLDRELGVQPLSATTELYNAISAPTAAQVVVEEPARLVAALPLVGRAVELRRLVTSFEAIGDDGVLVMIEGESGVGKTRLAEEALGALQAGGTPVIAARAQAGERGLAYGVVAQLLREAIGSEADALPQPLRGEAARLLPQLGAAPSGRLDDPGCRLRFLESVCEIVAGRSRRAGAVVFVDDLHWCDPASLDALAYLARRLDDRRLMLLCARRIDEPDPEHRLAALVELGKRIQLGRLGRDDVVGVAMRTGLDKGAADEVFRESEGLALFVAELLATGDGTDRPTGGARAAIEARLDAVSEASAQVLSAAAVIGRTFDADTVRFASGRSSEEIAVALEELGARGLILERGEGYDFGHERLRAIVEQRIGLARRRLLHRRIARALSARRGEPAILARHFELAGLDEQAAAAYATAGDRARALSAGAEAIAHYEAAHALGHTDAAMLHEAIGDARTLRGEYSEALAAYDGAAADAVEATVARLEHKLGAVHERRGDWELADSHYQQALTLGADPAIVVSDRSRVAWRRGDADEARALGLQALALAEAGGPGGAAGATAAAAQANNILGLLGCGRRHLQRSLELSRELADPSIRIAALNNLARDHAAAGELEQAEALMRQALQECVTQGDRHHEAALHANLADVLHKAGRPDAAIDELKQAAPTLAAIGAEGEDLYPGVWSLEEW